MDQMLRELAFSMRYSDGCWVRIYADGTVTGVPGDTVIFNRIPHLLHSQLGMHMSREAAGDNLERIATTPPQCEPQEAKRSTDTPSQTDLSLQS